MTLEAREQISLNLANQVKTIIGLEKLPTPLKSDLFLEAA